MKSKLDQSDSPGTVTSSHHNKPIQPTGTPTEARYNLQANLAPTVRAGFTRAHRAITEHIKQHTLKTYVNT